MLPTARPTARKAVQTATKVIKALRYPCFVLAIAVLVSMMMLTLVLPEFATLYSSFDTPLPWFTRQLISLAEVITDYGFVGLLCLSCLIVGYVRLRQKKPLWKTREQEWLLKLPIVSSLLRGKSLNQIFTILSMTQQAGLTLPEGLDAAATIRHPLYQNAIQQIQAQLHQGTSLYHATQHHDTLFPAPCPQLIRVGEETGALDAIFTQLAEWHEGRVQQQADMLTQTLEPLLMMIVGGWSEHWWLVCTCPSSSWEMYWPELEPTNTVQKQQATRHLPPLAAERWRGTTATIR